MEEMEELSENKHELMDRVSTIMNKANEYRNSFSAYEYLWVDDRQEFMRQFLMYNHVLTHEELEMHAEEGVPESPPTLEQFKEQVTPISATELKDYFFCQVGLLYVKPYDNSTFNSLV